MAKYTVFESTNMGSTKFAERIFDAVSDKDIENGTFGYLEGLADGESVIYKFKAGFKAGEPVVVVDNPAWKEDTSRLTNQRRDKYINEAGVPFRVRVVKKLDEFAVTIEGVTEATRNVVTGVSDFTAKPVYLGVDETTGKLIASLTKDEENPMIAQVMRKRMVGAVLSTPLRNYGYANGIYEVKVITLV